jgi:protoporphyrinogen oxidase
MYPKLGPGQLWEYVAEDVKAKGALVRRAGSCGQAAYGRISRGVGEALNAETGERETIEADYFFSTMPIKELMHCLDAPVPANVMEVSDGLIYRDFITVGVLLKK